ncbi:MAG TPA: sulfite exporter TauE/SafE family protein [Rudaea sp.]|jgi:sulfite exporter TauE/SafE|nr:sulfite exporter TauE/SafE family protein [Rudaea sp.]
MTGNLTLTAAFLLGLFASGHCILMCGGISGALMLATQGGGHRHPPAGLLLAMQAGRVSSYMLAAALLAGAGASLVHFVDQDNVRVALRIISAATFTAIGVTLLGRARGIDLGLGRAMWPRLAPIARKLIPARRLPQAFALGAIWGWMPCGFVYSVLLLAWLSMDPMRGALTMLLFGLGTMPALLASAYGTAGVMRVFGRAGARSTMGMALLVMAVLTLSGPWLVAHSGIHAMHWLSLDCITP